VNRRNETFNIAEMNRNFLFFLSKYSLAIRKKGRADDKYSLAKPLCPNVEPGGITVGRTIKLI
jgi:hypothetical protein